MQQPTIKPSPAGSSRVTNTHTMEARVAKMMVQAKCLHMFNVVSGSATARWVGLIIIVIDLLVKGRHLHQKVNHNPTWALVKCRPFTSAIGLRRTSLSTTALSRSLLLITNCMLGFILLSITIKVHSDS